MLVCVSLKLDTRRLKAKSDTFPIKLLVTCDSKAMRYQTIYDATETEFKSLLSSRTSEKNKEMKDNLKKIIREAEYVANSLNPFSYEKFEKDYLYNNQLFYQRKRILSSVKELRYEFDATLYANRFPIFDLPKPEPGTILAIFLSYISKLLSEDRIRTAASYQTSYRVISRFRGNVKFNQIDVAYLKQFEAWMLQQEYSKTTVGIYTRCLRCIFNEADFQGVINKNKCYPFGRRKYQCPVSRNVKKAITLEEVSKLYYYEPICIEEKKAKDFWLFSYFANGINPTDIAHLKYKNIEGEFLIFERAKTENSTRTSPKPIAVFLSEELKAIIEDWGNKDKKENNYLFPILESGITALRKVELIELFVQAINDWMAKIKKKLGIEKKLTTYVARHTFSTVMKRSGVSTEFIQEALGHSDKRTTENYLDSFELKVKKEFAGLLTSFKNSNALPASPILENQ
jgi:integrase/recombinase XerD